jgi:uncharacterized protein (TIGR02145 family)
MKKIFFIFAIISLVTFGCTKVDTIVPTIKKVGVINGSFEAQYGDISIAKDYTSPVAGWNMWTLLRKDGSKVDGTEFITGSAEQIWWSTNGNNPAALPAGTPYSILIPDEDLRLQLEVLDPTGHETVYFGITDFNPENVQFPLSIKAIRVGDYLSLNTDAITSLPGANLTITANFQLANVDIPTTANKSWNPALSFGFDDIKYGSLVPTTVTVGSGDFVLYSGNKKKVFGPITITITEAPSSSTPANTYTVTVPINKVGIAGKGTALKLTTTKIGWYDSQTIVVSDNDIVIKPINVSVDSVYDVDGNAYSMVRIGTQTWMVQNLKTTKYNDGTPIPSGISYSTGTYLWYNNDQNNKNPYGAMYNWYAVNTEKLAPVGWHVPSYAEWTTLANYVGGWYPTTTNFQGTGFAPLLAGLNYDGPNAPYMYMGSGAWWWTFSDAGGNRGYYVHFDGANNQLGSANDMKYFHFSVRCIKD